MSESTALAIPERSVEEVIAQVGKIQNLMQRVMKEGEHYGVIPGTQKPTLFKAGAEKLCFLFRLDPQYEVTSETNEAGHLSVTSRCTLWHIGSGVRMGSGMGSCSSKETKYAFRHAARTCPKCGKEAIIKGKDEYGGGYLCFKKKDGCGAKFSDDEVATWPPAGQVANENLADTYNTVLKMSNKRALVAGTLNVTAASDIFTQDLEDYQLPVGPSPAGAADSGGSPPAPEAQAAAPAAPQESLPIDVAAERSILLGRIKGLADKKRLSATIRADLWKVYCTGTTPENVHPAQLHDLYAHLQKVPAQTDQT